MKNEAKHPGMKAKWRKILKGNPTKDELHQFLKDLQQKDRVNQTNATA